jgi:hypothetical protein
VAFETITGDINCYEEAFSAIATTNGYTVSANYNCGFGIGNFKSSLLFLDENGDSLQQINNLPANGWMKPDGTDLIFAGGNKAGLVYDTIVIAKTNANGDSLWSRNYQLGVCNNVVYDVAVTDDGYVFTGFHSTTACTSAVYDAFVLKLDKNGNEQWLKTFGGIGNQQFYVVKEIEPNIIAAFGWRDAESDSLGKFYLVKMNASTGDSISSFTIDTPGIYRGYGMDYTAEGHFILSGTYYNQAVVYKTDSDGKTIWRKQLGITCGSSYFKAYHTIDKQYAFLIYESISGDCRSSLIKTDTAGNELWRKNFPATIRDVSQPEIGSFLLSGFRIRPINFISDVYIARFDTTYADTSTSVGSSQLAVSSVKVLPNPNNGNFFLEVTTEKTETATLSIYDITGKLIQTSSHELINGINTIAIINSHIAKGVYLVEINSKKLLLKHRIAIY